MTFLLASAIAVSSLFFIYINVVRVCAWSMAWAMVLRFTCCCNWNESTNEVTVPEQFTGYTYTSYGEVYVMEGDAYQSYDDGDGVEGVAGHCYYDPETKTFHFQLVYYVSSFDIPGISCGWLFPSGEKMPAGSIAT